MKIVRHPFAIALAAALFTPVSSSSAAEPALHGLVLFEIQNDWNTESDNPDQEVNTLTGTIEPYFNLSLTEGLALEAAMVLEQVQDPDAGEDSYFDNEGGYIDELKISYTGDNYNVYAGKFHPAFGSAWDLAPGIYGADFAEDYELSEKIGVGGGYTLGNEETGEYALAASSFFADTTFMSGSVITSRGDLDEDDGGVSNTEDFSSYTLTLDAGNALSVQGLNANIGYRSQSEGDADTGLDREHGYVIGVNYTFPINEDIEATVLGEWAGIRNLDGGSDDVNYLTTSLSLTILENWNFAVSYTDRDTKTAADPDTGDAVPDVDDYVYQISGGYAFDNGLAFDIGYSRREESDIETDTLGALLSYTFEF